MCTFIAVQGLSKLHEVLKSTTVEVERLKNKVMTLQAEKIKSQEQLLDIKKETVETFQSTLKSEMKSYRDVCASRISSVVPPVINNETLTSVVKKVVSEEDKQKNIIIYGVKEEENSEPDVIVSKIFAEIGEKPLVNDCVRVGKKNSDGRPRPIKVTLRSCAAVINIQRKAKNLKNRPATKQVFIAPDRTREEREERKKLVVILKEKIRRDPSKYHFIAENEVRSREMKSKEVKNDKSSVVGVTTSEKNDSVIFDAAPLD